MNNNSYWDVLLPPEETNANEWTNKYYYLSKESSAYSGKWTSYCYQEEILKAFTPQSGIRVNGENIKKVTLLKSSRIGYTCCLAGLIGFIIHRMPTSVLLVEPTESDAKKISKDVVATMIRDNQHVLNGLIEEDPKPDGKSSILYRKFSGGGVLQIAGAFDPKSFRAVSRQIILLDECDAYKSSLGKEGDPVKLAETRCRDFWNRLVILGSTPVGNKKESRIYNSYLNSDQRKFLVPCPKCGHFQELNWKQMDWNGNDYSNTVYRCIKCGHGIEHKDRKEMVNNGYWKSHNSDGESGHAGYAINALYSNSPSAQWSLLAEEYSNGKEDPEKIKVFYNTVLGLPYNDDEDIVIDIDDILSKVDQSYSLGDVPEEVVLLTGGIDVQGNRLELAIWGWAKDEECWLIYEAIIEGDPTKDHVWEQAESIFNSKWGPNKLEVSLVAIDSGYLTEKVANICASNRKLFRPIKGSSIIDSQPIKRSKQPRASKNKTSIFKKDQLFVIGTNKIKSILFNRLVKLVRDNDEARLHFPSDTTPTFCEHITSEVRIKEGKLWRWKNPSGKRNESWDIWVYSYAMMILVVRSYNQRTVWEQLKKRKKVIVVEDKPQKQIPQQIQTFNRFNRPFSRGF